MDRSEIAEALEDCEFFRGLGKTQIGKMASHSQMVTYKAGETVFQQGDFGEHLYVIHEGRVFLERATDLGVKKGSVVTAMLGEGRVLGCWSTILGASHNLMSSATCQKPSKIVVMEGDALRDMMTDDKEFGFQVLERLCFLLRDRIQSVYGALEKI